MIAYNFSLLPIKFSFNFIKRYFQYAGGFEPRKAFDITAEGEGQVGFDPMFIVEAVKK